MPLLLGKPSGHMNLSTRGGHLIRPTSPKSPSASAFESIEGSDDEDNMTDNSKVDSTYLYTNGDAVSCLCSADFLLKIYLIFMVVIMQEREG